MTQHPLPLRRCLREPIPEIIEAARLLDAAVSAHLVVKPLLAKELISLANMEAIRSWTESIWGANSPHVNVYKGLGRPTVPPERSGSRMPTDVACRALIVRDGYHCRFCGIPLVRAQTRKRILAAYPDLTFWGRRNIEQHAAFQAMRVQYDHIVPHSAGGTNELSNLVITCAPCNYGRMGYTIDEVALEDPRLRAPVIAQWDGLERFRVI